MAMLRPTMNRKSRDMQCAWIVKHGLCTGKTDNILTIFIINMIFVHILLYGFPW